MIKVIGTEQAAPTSSGAGTNLGNASMIRCYNSGGTDRLITVETASGNADIGTFTLKTKEVEYVDKNITDHMWAAHAEILFTPVVVMG